MLVNFSSEFDDGGLAVVTIRVAELLRGIVLYGVVLHGLAVITINAGRRTVITVGEGEREQKQTSIDSQL